MRTVKEVSRLTGVSVRTLHYYDAIGLLKPAEVTEAGYRLYDDTALGRLQNILLFRELQYQHIGELISFAREIQKKGVRNMDFQAFDTKKMEDYKAEVKERWGGTREYQEYEQKQEKSGDSAEAGRRMMNIFAELGALRQLSPSDRSVQEKIIALQKFITDYYYTCTDKILGELGKMYVDDERFKRNIDKAGGEGTAEFVKRAIEIHCAR